VQSYGVKPVGKKRMIKLLTDIYQQTHQCKYMCISIFHWLNILIITNTGKNKKQYPEHRKKRW
jgi:hypothetical protein